MFGDNLKKIRKAKGYSQEELAIKLNVVRQTISKWEKGLSVPDVEMLQKIADVLETDVSVLLGVDLPIEQESENDIAKHLAKISEQLAIKNRRSKKIGKIITIIITAAIVIPLLFSISTSFLFSVDTKEPTVKTEQSVVEVSE